MLAMKKTALLIGFISVASIVIVQDKSEVIKKEFEQLSWDWMNTWKAMDTVYISKIMAPEFRLLAVINGEFVVLKRAEWMKTVKAYIPTSFKYYDFDIGYTARQLLSNQCLISKPP
jgi:hypothetical protein